MMRFMNQRYIKIRLFENNLSSFIDGSPPSKGTAKTWVERKRWRRIDRPCAQFAKGLEMPPLGGLLCVFWTFLDIIYKFSYSSDYGKLPDYSCKLSKFEPKIHIWPGGSATLKLTHVVDLNFRGAHHLYILKLPQGRKKKGKHLLQALLSTTLLSDIGYLSADFFGS